MTDMIERAAAAIEAELDTEIASGRFVIVPESITAAATAAIEAMRPEFRRCYDLGHADAAANVAPRDTIGEALSSAFELRQRTKDALRHFADAYQALVRSGYVDDPKGTALMYNVKDPHFLGPQTFDLKALSDLFDELVAQDGGSRL